MLGAAVRRQSALHEEARLLEHAGLVERVVQQVRAEQTVHALLHAHAAIALDAPEFRVVPEEVAENRKLIALDLGVAARRKLDLAHALDVFGVDRHGPRLVRAFGLREGWRGSEERERQRREAVPHGASGNALDVRIFNDTRRFSARCGGILARRAAARRSLLPRSRLGRCKLPPLLSRRPARWPLLRRHGCAARQGGLPAV